MPRATANVTVRHPTTLSVRMKPADVAKLSRLLGVRGLPEGFQRRLEDAINICRQHIRRSPPTDQQTALALDEIAWHAEALCLLLGQPGDAVAGPLALLRRLLPDGLDGLRQTQDALDDLTQAARWARQAPARHDLAVSPRSAKVSMAVRIAELLDDCGITPVLTTEPKPSAYLQVVKVALGYMGGGDMREIPVEGLEAWRQHVQRAMAGPRKSEHFCT